MDDDDNKLALDAGQDTEELINFIFRELSDSDTDKVILEREQATWGGLQESR